MILTINEKEYDCVSTITPDFVQELEYNVKTMDGKLHRSIKGSRTDYTVIFFNKDHKQYEELKRVLKQGHARVKFPISSSDEETKDYLVTVEDEIYKGVLMNGTHYYTGLSVLFERTDFDE